MRSLAGSLANGVLADAILFLPPPPPPIPPTNRKKVKGPQKVWKLVTEKTIYYLMKKGDVGMVKHFSKKYRNKG